MIGNLKCKPKEAENVTESGVMVGTMVTVKEPWLTYSVRGKDGRWLNIWRPALDDHSPRPGEPAIITEIIEGGRYGDQFHIASLDGRREDWFKSGDFEVLEPEAAAEAIAQFKEKEAKIKDDLQAATLFLLRWPDGVHRRNEPGRVDRISWRC